MLLPWILTNEGTNKHKKRKTLNEKWKEKLLKFLIFSSTAKNSSLLPAEKCGARLGRKIIQIIIKFSSSSSITEKSNEQKCSLLCFLSCLFSLKTTEILFFFFIFVFYTKKVPPTTSTFSRSFWWWYKEPWMLTAKIIKRIFFLIIRQPRVFRC